MSSIEGAGSSNVLGLDTEQRVELSRAILANCLDHWREFSKKPTWVGPNRAALEEVVRAGIPEESAGWQAALERLRNSILPAQAHLSHPRFFAFVSSPSNFVSCLADLLASTHNPFAGSWLEGSGAQTVERVLIEWLAKELGLPRATGGIVLSGGSLSNLTAIVTARESRFGVNDWRSGVVYYSDQTHSSVGRGLRILGFSRDQIRVLPSGEDFRLSPGVFSDQVRTDRRAGQVPFCLIANAGTTNTGAVLMAAWSPQRSSVCMQTSRYNSRRTCKREWMAVISPDWRIKM